MSHSLIGADCHTHGRIMVTALLAAMSLIGLGTAAWRADTAPAALIRSETPVVKPTMTIRSAATDTASIR
jgi:hypothetical protein